METGGISLSESCEKVVYSVLCTDLASPALHRLHSVISDFRPPSVTESGEAALRRLLASRASGGHSTTSDDPAPGSLTVFQSSRVARPQDGSKAPNLVRLLSSSARSFLDTSKQRMLRPVSEVADMETRLGPAGRHVDPVFQHSWRRYVGFNRDLVKAGSVGFAGTAVAHIGLFFVAKNAGVQRFIIDARASNRHFLNPPSGPLVEFQGAHEDVQNFFVGSADVKNAFHQMRISEWLQLFSALPAVLASELGYTGKRSTQKKTFPDSLICSVLTTLPKMSRTTVCSRGVLILARR